MFSPDPPHPLLPPCFHNADQPERALSASFQPLPYRTTDRDPSSVYSILAFMTTIYLDAPLNFLPTPTSKDKLQERPAFCCRLAFMMMTCRQAPSLLPLNPPLCLKMTDQKQASVLDQPALIMMTSPEVPSPLPPTPS